MYSNSQGLKCFDHNRKAQRMEEEGLEEGFHDEGLLSDEESNVPLQKLEFWRLSVHVQGKEISVAVGDATQRVKWLAQVGIARWDETEYKGWKRLGVPTAIRLKHRHGDDVDMNGVIREVLHNGDHIYVETSLGPVETR